MAPCRPPLKCGVSKLSLSKCGLGVTRYSNCLQKSFIPLYHIMLKKKMHAKILNLTFAVITIIPYHSKQCLPCLEIFSPLFSCFISNGTISIVIYPPSRCGSRSAVYILTLLLSDIYTHTSVEQTKEGRLVWKSWLFLVIEIVFSSNYQQLYYKKKRNNNFRNNNFNQAYLDVNN